MERSIVMPLGVVVERREIDNRWQRWRWRPVAVIPGAGEVDGWKELQRGDRWVRWHAATLPLELYRTDTDAYRYNLSNKPPVIYVVLRPAETDDAPHEVIPFRVTASPFEAQDYLDSGEEIVEGVPMPEGVIAWVQAFIDRHHVDRPFIKRQRKRHDAERTGSARRPPAARARGRHGRP